MPLGLVVALYRLGFGLLTFVALIVQMVNLAQAGTLDALNYLTFFTVMSNTIAAVTFLVGAARWRASRSATFDFLRGFSVVSMSLTGVVFAVLLSGTNVDTAIPWVNSVVHEVMPIVVVADWLLDPPQSRITYRQGFLWLIYPAIWSVYEQVEGAIRGKYHYPFTNPTPNGYGSVILLSLVLFVFVLVVSVVVVWLGNVRRPSEAAR
jgi:hypothetical protein